MKISVVTLTHNRLAVLQRCLQSVWRTQSGEHTLEVIVVDNNSTDDTTDWLWKHEGLVHRVVPLDQNYGVWARNLGFEVATGEYILQVDDDVVMCRSGWDTHMLSMFEDTVAAVGQQAWLRSRPLSAGPGGEVVRSGAYCDLLTGYCFMMRNLGFRYDPFFKFHTFDDDTQICFAMKKARWRIRACDPVASHFSVRGEVDWEERNACMAYLSSKWEEADLNWEESANGEPH